MGEHSGYTYKQIYVIVWHLIKYQVYDLRLWTAQVLFLPVLIHRSKQPPTGGTIDINSSPHSGTMNPSWTYPITLKWVGNKIQVSSSLGEGKMGCVCSHDKGTFYYHFLIILELCHHWSFKDWTTQTRSLVNQIRSWPLTWCCKSIIVALFPFLRSCAFYVLLFKNFNSL